MENLLKYHKDYVSKVYDCIPDVDKSTYEAILDETYWDLFTNPQFDTEESRMIKLLCNEQIRGINIPSSVNKQRIKNIITNTEKYKTFVNGVIMVDDDVAEEFLKLYKYLVTNHYEDLKNNGIDLYLAMNFVFFEAWLDTPYVSEKSKQREHFAKRMIDKFNKDLSNTAAFSTQFIKSINCHKKEIDYTEYANLINYRDYVDTGVE